MKLDKKQKEAIEEICGDIYEVGHAHGGNAFRGFLPKGIPKDMLKLRKPKMVNIGWGKYCNKLIKFIEKEVG